MTGELFLTFVRRLIFAFLFIGLVASLQAHGQISGPIGIYTREIPVFTAQSTTLASTNFPDFGFGCNVLSYQTSGFTGTIDFDWVPPVAPPAVSTPIILKQASYSQADTAVHTLQLGGYYPNLRSTVTPSGGSLNAQYTAQANSCPIVASGLGSNGDASPIVPDRNYQAAGFLTATTLNIAGPTLTGDTIVITSFDISFAGAPSAGNLQLAWGTSSACSTKSGPSWEMLTTASTSQFLTVLVPQRSLLVSAYPYACFTNNSGVTLSLNVAYASVHGL